MLGSNTRPLVSSPCWTVLAAAMREKLKGMIYNNATYWNFNTLTSDFLLVLTQQGSCWNPCFWKSCDEKVSVRWDRSETNNWQTPLMSDAGVQGDTVIRSGSASHSKCQILTLPQSRFITTNQNDFNTKASFSFCNHPNSGRVKC